MAEKTRTLEEMIKDLPPELYREAADFVQFLYEKRVRKPKGKLKLDWRGGLSDLRDKYTSVELQHEIRDMWDDEDVSS
jgi:hypothetical protein